MYILYLKCFHTGPSTHLRTTGAINSPINTITVLVVHVFSTIISVLCSGSVGEYRSDLRHSHILSTRQGISKWPLIFSLYRFSIQLFYFFQASRTEYTVSFFQIGLYHVGLELISADFGTNIGLRHTK